MSDKVPRGYTKYLQSYGDIKFGLFCPPSNKAREMSSEVNK